MDTNKTTYIRCRVDEKTKELWNKATNKNAVNGSELLRRYIENYIKETLKEEKI